MNSPLAIPYPMGAYSSACESLCRRINTVGGQLRKDGIVREVITAPTTTLPGAEGGLQSLGKAGVFLQGKDCLCTALLLRLVIKGDSL